mmetsp:Transcript_37211/g.99023  ORF Transcript_37211/g.99023 Transcript_37211/m.99023 type:complete len:270 (-) Transcript_37211:1209-2018(-)
MSFRLKFRNYSRVNSRRSTRVICLIANSSNLKDALEQRFPDIVDQAVVACSSDGKSRGCAFVTVRWQEFVNKDSTGKPEHVVKQFCDSVNSAPILGRPVLSNSLAVNDVPAVQGKGGREGGGRTACLARRVSSLMERSSASALRRRSSAFFTTWLVALSCRSARPLVSLASAAALNSSPLASRASCWSAVCWLWRSAAAVSSAVTVASLSACACVAAATRASASAWAADAMSSCILTLLSSTVCLASAFSSRSSASAILWRVKRSRPSM